ncbi:hypothetical protein PV10_03141 [Exophiala mesophila]|uniref:Uncharacterized protein n=1 Tax=Exophiala mesophila TaxID=212818 RepID=A0A0D1ZNI0_EXOME|nr:uncharacterized protein PV10_03141 [Exophiala mesophila]KIV95489.1 hypothetical protein PV10_03141 [Exophiala mesophila]
MSQVRASSPLSSPPATQSFSGQTTRADTLQYRPVKPLPYELAHHVHTYYEEGLFTQAYNFLLSITANSLSCFDRHLPVMVPSAPHLSLAATISVHPLFTTRTTSRDKWNQSNSALRLLKIILKSAGPVNANLVKAFTFRRYDPRSSEERRSPFNSTDQGRRPKQRAFDPEPDTPFAKRDSLWTEAGDFWSLVGWAFNCACLPEDIYAQRWAVYSQFLSFLLDVLDIDWNLRNRTQVPEESLLWQYVELSGGNHRRILRAIFANGTSKSTNEFRPIFDHELKGPIRRDLASQKRRGDVNIDQEMYGDYLMQDESDLSLDEGDEWKDFQRTSRGHDRPSKRMRTRTPSSRRLTPRNSSGSLRSQYANGEDGPITSGPTNKATLGDSLCLTLRIRLLTMLTYISTHPTLTATSPTTFPDLEDLLTFFVEYIKPLPLSEFASFVLPQPTVTIPPPPPSTTQPHNDSSPHNLPHFEPIVHLNLLEALLQHTLEPSAPSIRSDVIISARKLETEYLPFAAAKNSVDANARVSILLEGLIRRMVQMGIIHVGAVPRGLTVAVDEGVQRRAARVGKDKEKDKDAKGGKPGPADEAWSWLTESGMRLKMMVRDLYTST